MDGVRVCQTLYSAVGSQDIQESIKISRVKCGNVPVGDGGGVDGAADGGV